MFKYVKGNFIAGEDLEALDLARLNEKGRKWALEVAGVREHGTTHEKPLIRYHSAWIQLPSATVKDVFVEKEGREAMTFPCWFINAAAW